MLTITTGKVHDKKKWQEMGWTAIDVTVKSASKNARSLTPTWDMVMGYKRGTLSEEKYTKQYEEILKRSQHEEHSRWVRTVQNLEKVVFLCYCPVGDFCHRHLLAEEMVRFATDLGVTVSLLPEESAAAMKLAGSSE